MDAIAGRAPPGRRRRDGRHRRQHVLPGLGAALEPAVPRVRPRPQVRRPHRHLAPSSALRPAARPGGTRAGRPGRRAASSRSTRVRRAVLRAELVLLLARAPGAARSASPAPARRCPTGQPLERPGHAVHRRVLRGPRGRACPARSRRGGTPRRRRSRPSGSAGSPRSCARAGPTAAPRPRARSRAGSRCRRDCPVVRRKRRNSGVPSESGEKLGVKRS